MCLCVAAQTERNTYSLMTPMSPFRRPLEESDPWHSLEEVLLNESESEVFVEGISYALFKLAELGLVYPAQILLRHGANLHFEGDVQNLNF